MTINTIQGGFKKVLIRLTFYKVRLSEIIIRLDSFNHKALLILVIFFSKNLAFAQVFVTNQNPEVYIDNLIADESIHFSNVQLGGNPESIGYFELNNSDSANLGFNKGILLTNGIAEDFIQNIALPNQFSNGLDSIPELINAVPSMCGDWLFDGLLLSFDFVPVSSTIALTYVFASVEYDLYVCSIYFDAFAFLISGPGIIGNQNLAIVPGTNIPVTICSINNGAVGGAGSIENEPCILTNSQYFNTSPPPGISFNGFTTTLVASATNLIPCQTYSLKLMIADYCDATLSSGVFIAANSFSSGPDLCNITKTFSVQNALDSGILVYPNPTAGQFTISLDNIAYGDYVIFDQLGRLVKKGLLSGPKTNISLDVESGIYYLMVGERVAKLQVMK